MKLKLSSRQSGTILRGAVAALLFALWSVCGMVFAAGTPDLVVTSISYSSATGIFTSTVKNQGTAATPAGVIIGVGYLVDGVYRTWGSYVNSLAAGASATIGSNGGTYAIPAGSHTITGRVDDAHRIAESNENNNQLAQTVNISLSGNLPDLVVTSISYSSATGIFTSTVKNQGTVATPAGLAIGVA
jgi:subtilase family serine protease